MQKIVTLNNAEEIFKIFSKFENGIIGDINYLFRGQANCEWGLEPSLARKNVIKMSNRSEALLVEEKILHQYEAVAKSLMDVKKANQLPALVPM